MAMMGQSQHPGMQPPRPANRPMGKAEMLAATDGPMCHEAGEKRMSQVAVELQKLENDVVAVGELASQLASRLYGVMRPKDERPQIGGLAKSPEYPDPMQDRCDLALMVEKYRLKVFDASMVLEDIRERLEV